MKMIISLIEMEQQHTFAAAVSINRGGNLGPFTWEGGWQEDSMGLCSLSCVRYKLKPPLWLPSYRKIIGISGYIAMAQVSE